MPLAGKSSAPFPGGNWELEGAGGLSSPRSFSVHEIKMQDKGGGGRQRKGRCILMAGKARLRQEGQ